MTDEYVYAVMFTSYEDDYKHRYNNGVYPTDKRLFKKKEDANKLINSEIYDRINEHFSDCDFKLEDVKKGHRKYMSLVEPIDEYEFPIEIKKAYKDDYNILLDLYFEYMKGKYVDYKFDWSLDKVKIE